ncbi:MAG: ribonuclease J [Anaerolineae bacterium]|nr:ribonuclease J [Anaerolineae bacterium]
MSKKLQIIPIGGLGEIGKNMLVIAYDGEAIVIDTGMMFPENDMLGIDYIIPDFQFLLEEGLKMRGIFLTHGHEDHVGAITHVVEAFPNTPVYATRLTAGFVEVKLRQARMLDKTDLHVFEAGDTMKAGPFSVETFHQTHSIPDCVGFGINTPEGLLVHTGDFKFDYTPIDGWPPDFGKIAEFSQRGVLALLSDSTNAVREGWTPSETTLEDGFDRVFSAAKGRIIVATFASHLSRIQQIIHAAIRHNRKVAVTGYSMVENVKMATQLGYLKPPADLMIPLDEIDSLPASKVVILSTGTQGEPSAGLSRLAQGRHRQLDIRDGDTVIMSAHVIPGNEEFVSRTINRLFQRGAHVSYYPIDNIHVSGHASAEELKLMLNLVRPKYFIPVHGELRHLIRHGQLAEGVGIPSENIAVIENGVVVEFENGQMRLGERKPGRYIFVDGYGVGDIGPSVLRDREILARDGFVMVIVTLDADTGELLSEPEIISRGFVYLPEAETLFEDARNRIRDAIADTDNRMSVKKRRDKIEGAVKNIFQQETKRRPMIFSHINLV